MNKKLVFVQMMSILLAVVSTVLLVLSLVGNFPHGVIISLTIAVVVLSITTIAGVISLFSSSEY